MAYAYGAIADLAPDWSIELHETPSGEASLMLMPEDADDEVGPTFVLRSDDGAFFLARYRWDRYSEVGEFYSLPDAMLAVRRELAALATPPSQQRH
jgi:hypothetical protein